MLVHQILKSKGDHSVVTVTSTTPILDVLQVLAEKRIGGVVVSADGTTVEGILSERDIVRALARRGPECLEDKAGDMMTPNPSCCARGDSMDDVLNRMTVGRFRHMPVTEDGALIGIVTIGDVVKARMDELAMEKSALQGMIMGH